MLKFTTTGVMCRDCHDAERKGTPAVAGAAPSSAASWRTLAMRLADESTTVLDNAHWEVKHGSGDLLTTIKAVREKYRLETQMPPNAALCRADKPK